MTSDSALAQEIADYVCDLRPSDLPQLWLEEAKVLTQDYVGVALRGSMTEPARIVAGYQRAYGSTPRESTLLGTNEKLASPAAAFANAVASHSIEMDDVDAQSLLHFGAPVVSASLAAAELYGSAGSQFLLAVIAGCRVMRAISAGSNPSMRDRGFHSTATCGIFGSVAAAGILGSLDPGQLASALGIAGAYSSGLFDIYGPTMQKPLQAGPAAAHGIVSTQLSSRGYEGSPTIFDGRFGFFHAFSDQGDAGVALSALRSDGPLDIEFKPHACFRPLHTAIDCCLELRPALAGKLEDVASIRIERHPMWAHYHNIPAPVSSHEARGSLNFAVAVTLVKGEALIEQFALSNIYDPLIRRLSEVVSVEEDADLPRGDSCRVTVIDCDGRVFRAKADSPKGSRQSPMTVSDHNDKFRYLTRTLVADGAADRALSLLRELEELPSLDPLLSELSIGANRR